MTTTRAGMVSANLRVIRPPIFELAAKLVFGIVFAIALYFSNRIDLLVSGSDATSLLIGPKPIVQLTEAVCVAVCLMAPANPRWRMALAAPALVFATLATHRVLIDGNHGELKDIYGLTSVQQLSFNPGQEGGFQVSTSVMAVTLRPAKSDAIRVVTPPLLGLDRSQFALLKQ